MSDRLIVNGVDLGSIGHVVIRRGDAPPEVYPVRVVPPSEVKPRRRTLREWWQQRRPRVHLGPCEHDCDDYCCC